jgi:phosphoribosylformylglycinamidine cyclo-ligase
MRYADAGVDISVADEAKRRIAAMAGKTARRGVLAPIGGFGALFELDRKRWRDPILVASADGVGTKLKIAFATGIHSTVGADILNHCVNDILTHGAEPLFFLDYLAMGKMDPHIVEQVIEGMSRAAKQASCSLIGGETAEMPGFYAEGEYDLAGFIVGAVERSKQLDLSRVRPGDVLLAQLGGIDRDELLGTFNLGVGMILVVPAKLVSPVETELRRRREKFFLVGRIEKAPRGKPRVVYSGKLPL